MSKKTKWWLCGILALILLFGVGCIAVLNYLYPFGYRGCTLPCMELALEQYADDHDGCYPDSEQGAYHALQKLYPKYATARMLAGVTGNVKAIEPFLESGNPLDGSMTSWVYIPGLCQHNSPDLAILWEDRKGILPNGRRASSPVRAVLFNSPTVIKLIPESEWDSFIKQQESLRNQK